MILLTIAERGADFIAEVDVLRFSSSCGFEE